MGLTRPGTELARSAPIIWLPCPVLYVTIANGVAKWYKQWSCFVRLYAFSVWHSTCKASNKHVWWFACHGEYGQRALMAEPHAHTKCIHVFNFCFYFLWIINVYVFRFKPKNERFQSNHGLIVYDLLLNHIHLKIRKSSSLINISFILRRGGLRWWN